MDRDQVLKARSEEAVRYLTRTAFLTRGAAAPDGLNVREGDVVLSGYGLEWDDDYRLYGNVYERFARGAFKDRMPDVRFLIQHDGLALARSVADTMVLEEDDKGLRFYVALNPDDPDTRSLESKVDRGAVNGASIGFTMRGDSEQKRTEDEDGKVTYEVLRVGQLFEISAVTFPAYESSDLEVANRNRFPFHRSWRRISPAPDTCDPDRGRASLETQDAAGHGAAEGTADGDRRRRKLKALTMEIENA